MRACDNPFRTERVLAVRYRPQGTTWEALLARLEALRWRAAIVGPEGSGKTTLLEDLAPRLEARGLSVRLLRAGAAAPAPPHPTLDPGPWAPDPPGSADAVFLDSAECLGPLAWRRFLRATRRAGCVVVTLHRPGRLPTLVECATSPELLEGIVRAILGDAGGPPRALLDALYARHRGNLREAIRELYDRAPGLPRAAPPDKIIA